MAAATITILTIGACFAIAVPRLSDGEAWFENLPYPYISFSGQDYPQYYVYVTGFFVASTVQVAWLYQGYCWLEGYRAILPADEPADVEGWWGWYWHPRGAEFGSRVAEKTSARSIYFLYTMSAVAQVNMAVTDYRPMLDNDQHRWHTQSGNALFVFMTLGMLEYVWHMDRLTEVLSKPPGRGEAWEDIDDQISKCDVKCCPHECESDAEEEPRAPQQEPIAVALEVAGAGRRLRFWGSVCVLVLAVLYVGVGGTWMGAYCVKRSISRMTLEECSDVGLSRSYCHDFLMPSSTNVTLLVDLQKLGDDCIRAATFHVVSQHACIFTLLVFHIVMVGLDIGINPPEKFPVEPQVVESAEQSTAEVSPVEEAPGVTTMTEIQISVSNRTDR